MGTVLRLQKRLDRTNHDPYIFPPLLRLLRGSVEIVVPLTHIESAVPEKATVAQIAARLQLHPTVLG